MSAPMHQQPNLTRAVEADLGVLAHDGLDLDCCVTDNMRWYGQSNFLVDSLDTGFRRPGSPSRFRVFGPRVRPTQSTL